jgi:hypothetical protein
MKNDNQSISLKQESNDHLRRIANVLLLNASFTDNIGLLNGKMGISIFFYKYGRYTGNKIFTDYAGELIDEIYEEICTNTSVDFANGLTGIGWGIEYMVENGFIDADTDEALADIDNAVYRSMFNTPLLLDSGNDLFGYGLYCITRLRGHENDDDNLNTLIKKEHLIYLTDECERLLVHKRYLEFNILQLSAPTINSILWFLLEMERLGLFPSKVRKILKYLPDYITPDQTDNKNTADKKIFNDLAHSIAINITDKNLRDQYKSLTGRINGSEIALASDNKILLSNLKQIHLQSLLYRPYIINNRISDSFERAFSVIDNEEEWNKTLDGLNNSNLGLTGLAGTGLFLLDCALLPAPCALSSEPPAPRPLP